MSARRQALEALLDICDGGAYANLRLKNGLRGLSSNETQWVSALVYETLEKLALIDHYIEAFAKGRIQPKIRGVLRLGVCDMLFMSTPVHAACDESVKLSKEIGKSALGAYVNATLRNIGRAAENDSLPALPTEKSARWSIQYGFPEFLIKEYLSLYGDAFTEELLSYRQHGMTVRAQEPYTSEELEGELNKKGIAYRRGNIVNDAFHLEKGLELKTDEMFKSGRISVQSESAMLVCRAAFCPQGRILDACAAPGGKTAYLSSLAKGKNHINAWEVYPHRVELLKNTLERLHVDNVTVECRDASVFDAQDENSMDSVLLDVPCSGFGLSDKPDIRYRKSEEAVLSLCKVQEAILECCSRYVKPGGILVYSTCTISRRENEDRINAFLNKHNDFKSVSLSQYLPKTIDGESGMVQLFPHVHGTEGFFIAKMERTQ